MTNIKLQKLCLIRPPFYQRVFADLIASCCLSFNLSVIAVLTKPGAIQFTVIPRDATSFAKDFDIPS